MARTRALFQLGIDLDDNPSASKTEEQDITTLAACAGRKDFFIQRNGERFAGTHLIVDLRGAGRREERAYVTDTQGEDEAGARGKLKHQTRRASKRERRWKDTEQKT